MGKGESRHIDFIVWLYICGYLAILFCCGVLLWVAGLLGWF